MTWNEYWDYKYFVQKEYYYYLNTFNRNDESEKKFKHYCNLSENIANFEREVIQKAIKDISKENFKKMLDK